MVPVVLRREVRSRRPLVMVMVMMMATSATRPASAVRVFARTGGSLPEFATTCHPVILGGLVHHRVRAVVLSQLAVAASLLRVLLRPDDVQVEHLLLLLLL